MPKQTLQERIIRYLTEAQGAVEVPSSSRKYRQLNRSITMPNGRTGESYYFIGRAGAIRVGRCASKSQSFTDAIMPKVEAWEKENSDETNR